MANVGFKLGTQAKVDALLKTPGTSVVEGSFYLTSDTHRLYIGQKATADDTNAQLFAVNEGVITVDTIEDLPKVSTGDSSVYAGRFYYVTNGNILCVYNGKSWVQINTNTDTYVNSHSYSIKDGKITDKIGLSNGGNVDATFTVEGANGIQITGTGTTLTITGDKYSLSSTVADNKATVKLDSANTADDTSVVLAGGDNVTITQNTSTKEVTIESKDTKLTGLTGAAAAEGFTITGHNSDGGDTTAATINPQIKVGKTTQPVAKFVNGTATLDVYSTKDIDDKMKALNAMVYKGTLGKAGTVETLPTTNICVGDTYLAAEDVTINEHTVHAGSLVIARGTEDASGFITTDTLVWDIVESTQDTDTQYSFQAIAGGIKLHGTAGGDTGQLVVEGGTDVSVATAKSDASANQTLTVNHKAVTRTDSADAALDQIKNGETPVTVITGVTTSKTGHVTGVKTRKITLQDSNTTLASVSNAVTATGNIATITSTVKGTLGTGAETSAAGTFKVASTSMTVTGSSNQVNIDLTWGTF
jgi:hypothetical protein